MRACLCWRWASTTRPRRSTCAVGSRSRSTRSSPALKALVQQFGRPAGGARRRARGGAPLHLQPHRDLLRRADARAVAGAPGGRLAGRAAAASPAPSCSTTATCWRTARPRATPSASPAGLDSMVLGEPQILGQMKDAVRAADQAGALGTTLNQLFQRSFAVAKEVRTSTEIGAHSISMAAAAVRLAGAAVRGPRPAQRAVRRRRRDDRAGRHALRGAHARSPSPSPTARWSAARSWPSRFGGEAMRLADLPARLHEFDIVVSCTASTLPIIGLGAVERALKARKHRPMFMVDLAVPRDIEPEVKALRRRLPLHRRRPGRSVVQQRPGQPPGRRGAGRGHHRRRRAELHALAGPARHRAADPGSSTRQADDWRAPNWQRARKLLAKGETSTRCSKRCRAASRRRCCTARMAELHAGDGEQRQRAARTTVTRLFLRKERYARSAPIRACSDATLAPASPPTAAPPACASRAGSLRSLPPFAIAP